MGQNLTGQTIASTYEDLVQISGSSRNILTDGTGSEITNLAVTASHATSASYAPSVAAFPFTGSAQITGSLGVTGSITVPDSYIAVGLSNPNSPVPLSSGDILLDGRLNLRGTPEPAAIQIYNNGGGGALALTHNSAVLGNITLDRFSTLTSTTAIDITGSFRNAAFTNRVSAPSFTGSLFGTASFATTASFALNAGGADTGSLMVTGSVSSNTLTFTKGDGSTFNLTVDTGSAVSTPTGSLMVTGSATNNVLTFTKGDGSTFNITVDTGSAVTTPTGSLMVTGSVSSNTLTFTKGDGSTFNLTVDTGSAVSTGSLLVTASIIDATTTYTKGDGSTFTLTTNNVQNATSASFATTASYAETANLGTAASASFTGSTWTFNHNLGKEYVIIDCYDNNNEEIIPSTIDLVSTNQASITFPVSVQGVAVASLGNGTSQNQVTQSLNTYNSFSPINSVSSQVGSFSTGYTQKLTITSTGTYNLHVSASGPHWVDFTGLASGTTANLNIYMWVDSFNALPANSGSMIMFNTAAGTGNYVSYRTIITGSGTYWATNTIIGSSSTSVARNATLARRDFSNSAINPTAIIKTVDGDVILYNPGSSLFNTLYNFTGNQGTPIP